MRPGLLVDCCGILAVLASCGSESPGADPVDAPMIDAATSDSGDAIADGGLRDINVVCDDFERATLGASWRAGPGTGIVGGSDFGVTGTGGGAFIEWQGTAIGADQFSEAVVSADRDPDMMIQASARRRASDNARYGFHHNLEADPDVWQIKYDGVPSSQTAILASNPDLPAPGPGDTIRIEAVGNEVRGLLRCASCPSFVEVVRVIDTRPQAITGAGPHGVVSRARIDVANPVTYPAPVVESWCGGEVAP